MKKRLLFTAYSLELGGIEKALVNLLNRLDYEKYDVTLIVEKKEGIFLDMINSNVKVLEYKISDSKVVLFRKIKNRLKLIFWKLKLNKKYDFSCSFATYSIPGAHLALAASKNSTLWMHGNYYVNYGCDEDVLKDFLDGVFATKFKRVVFVSDENKREVCKHYQGISDKAMVCNNFIDGDEIIEKASEKVEFKRKKCPLFLNVGRHEEYQKRLTRIIEATEKLVKDGYKFQILCIGDGPDSFRYQDMVSDMKLDDVIVFLGKKKNPYPYYKMCDAVILSSEYEGYPVVFLESMVLDKPILSTKISDWEELDGKYGMFSSLDTDGVYKMMKKYLDKGFEVKERFDYNQFNLEVEKKIIKMINDK